MSDATIPQNSQPVPLPEDPLAMQKRNLNAQTAVIRWRELQRYFAAGSVVYVAPELDLVDVACQVALDNKAQVANWLQDGAIASVSDQQARDWLARDALVWSVVVKPWVLVQPHSPTCD